MSHLIYVAFDSNNDIEVYKQVQEWKKNNGEPFDFYDSIDLFKSIDKVPDEVLKTQIRERMDLGGVCVVLIHKTTKSFRRLIKWQVEHAVNSGMPVICINVNGIRSVDYDRIPTFLKKNLAIHIAFQAPILEYAINHWPNSHNEKIHKEDKKSYKYSEDVYNELGLQTFDL